VRGVRFYALSRLWKKHGGRPYIGIASLDESNVRAWIEANTERDNFYLKAGDANLLGKLETYLKGILGPVFEGGTEQR
jgi:hypothetical protein